MKRLLPSSLLGQVTLVLAVGLLLAQAFSAFALYRAQEQRRDASLVNSIAFRLIAESAGRLSPERQARREARRMERLGRLAERGLLELEPPPLDASQSGPPDRAARPLPPRTPPPFARLLRLSLQRSDQSPVGEDERRVESYEHALREVLEEQDVSVGQIRITRRVAGEDPHVLAIMQDLRRPPFANWRERRLLVAAIEQVGQPGWLTVRLPEPRRPREGLVVIIFQTLVIFLVLLTLLYLVLRRLTRPLAALTARVGDFSQRPDRPERLVESGPADMRRLISAHNMMEARISALLNEKNVMLGAIGHDLKTPLAALRVRIESHPDDKQRAALAASIEDITRTLDDILSLARVGAGVSQSEAVDLTALADGVVEEFEDLGEPVSLVDPPEHGSGRVVATVQVTWLKRALRNLVSNAVRYGNGAEVCVLKEAGMAILRVEDTGPGIAAERINDMLEPFTRGEASRNRATGGTGLGLTIARAIAEAHGGELSLANREGGGLCAQISVPL